MKNGNYPEDKLKNPNKQMRSMWSIPTPKASEKQYGKHPTQKPIALLTRIVQASTKENDIILDPFNGSGTTGIACKMLGNRKYIGIDTDSNFLEITLNRYNAILNQPQLFGNDHA